MVRWLWRVTWTLGLGLLLAGVVSATLVWFLPAGWRRPAVVAATILSMTVVAFAGWSRRRDRAN